MANKARTLEQMQAELQSKMNKIKSRQRAASTREKIVVGAAITSEANSDPTFAKSLCKILGQRVSRESDKSAIADLMKRLGCQSEQSELVSEPEAAEGGEGRAYTSPSVTSAGEEKPEVGEAPPTPPALDPANPIKPRLGLLGIGRL